MLMQIDVGFVERLKFLCGIGKLVEHFLSVILVHALRASELFLEFQHTFFSTRALVVPDSEPDA